MVVHRRLWLGRGHVRWDRRVWVHLVVLVLVLVLVLTLHLGMERWLTGMLGMIARLMVSLLLLVLRRREDMGRNMRRLEVLAILRVDMMRVLLRLLGWIHGPYRLAVR